MSVVILASFTVQAMRILYKMEAASEKTFNAAACMWHYSLLVDVDKSNQRSVLQATGPHTYNWSADVRTTTGGLTSSCIVAPGEVKPGHIMLAPDMTNFRAPLSTLSFFIISGY